MPSDNLQDIGVRAVVENLSNYTSSLNSINAKTAQMSKATTDATKSSGGFDKALSGITDKIKGLSPQASGAADALGGMGEMAGVAGAALGPLVVVVAAVAAGVGAFLALAQRGAGFSDLENGFASLTAAVDLNANELLTKMHAAAEGTISDMELLTMVNQTLIGVSKEFGHQFGEALPDLMNLARTVADATGRETTAVFDAITEAIKRGNTRSLQAIGIVIDQKKAYDEYAKSINKTTAELTKADQEQAILNAVQAQGKQIQDTLGNSAQSNADKQEKAAATVSNVIDKLSSIVQPVLGLILDAINSILDALSATFSPFITYLGGLISLVVDGLQALLQPVFEFVGRIAGTPATLEATAKNFFTGGVKMIGGLAQGILHAANQYVFPAILTIAQGIADFLIGLSPPPKGPLSIIDQGGANVMESWISGFTGVSLEPVEAVAQQVNDAMGDVATQGIDQVKARLLQLDKALQPFQDRLKIVEAQFDALKPAQEAAFRAIDRQLNAAQQALDNGDESAAALVQQLDAQRAQLQSYVDTQQEAIDNAQIQLAFAQAQQAQERAILDIRQKQIPVVKEPPKAPKPAGGGGGGATGELPEMGAGFGKGAGFNIAGDIAGAKQDIAMALGEGFAGAMPEINEAKGNIGKISDVLGQIGQVDIGSKLKEKFASIFDPAQEGSILNGVYKWFKNLFDADSPTGIVQIVNGLPIAVAKALNPITDKISGIFDTVKTAITTAVDSIVNPAVENSIPWRFNQLVTVTIPLVFNGLEKILTDNFVTPLNNIAAAVSAVMANIISDQPPLGINYYIRQIIDFFAGLPGKIEEGLATLGAKFTAAFVTPLVGAANIMITAINQLIGNVFDGIKKTIHSVADNFKGIEGVANLLKGIDAISAPQIPAIAVPAAAGGGVFGPGVFSANPREEIFGAADKMAVFPHEFVTSIRQLTAVMTQMTPGIQNMSSYNNTNVNRSISATFNGIPDSGEAMRRLATMQAFT